LEQSQFDQYVKDYPRLYRESLEQYGSDVGYYAEHKIRIIREAVSKAPQNILEYGCGIGNNIGFLKSSFPSSNIWGCDISSKSLEFASAAHPSAHFFMAGNRASELDEKFGLIFVANIFHHIPLKERPAALSEICRLMPPGGMLFVFEHNPYNPVTRRIVSQCPIDHDAILLRPGEMRQLIREAGLEIALQRYTLFFPAFLRSLSPIEKKLGYIPLGGQYYFQATKPQST
jgi:ubiquinone/menaquinone biosynthesis C-methylase UbiE